MHDGVCPIADSAPEMVSELNRAVVEIFRQAEGSSRQVAADDGRTYFYIMPDQAAALLEICDVQSEERAEVMKRIMFLQDCANGYRPIKPIRSRGR